MCICLFLERKENPDGPRHFYRDAKATKPQRRRIQSYMKPEYFKALPRSPTAMLLYMEGLFTRGGVKGRPRGAWGLSILGTTKRSAFSINTQSRFAKFVIDGVLGPPCLA